MNAIVSVDTSPTVQATIAARLRSDLIQGRYQPGEALKIRDIAQNFGTSTQPVREAIKQLVAEKALEALPNRSARVPVLSPRMLEDLTQLRVAIEGFAVGLAIDHVSAQDLRDLRKLSSLRPRDEETYLSSHRDFHFTLYRLSRSTAVMPVIENLWLQLGPYLRISTAVARTRGLDGQHHAELIDALERGDAKAARRALELDIRRSAALFSVDSAGTAGETQRQRADA